jgi:hypothetical protein
MSDIRKEIMARLGISARLGSKLKMEMSPYDFKVAKSDLLFYIKDNLNLLKDQQKQLGRINLKQISPEAVAMAKQVTNEIQSFKSQLTALQAKANAVSDLKTAQQEIASLMTQLTRTADAIYPKVSGPISSLQQAAQRAQVRTAVQNEPRIPGWIQIMKDQIRQAAKGAKGVDRKSDARDAYDQLIQSLNWIVRGLLNNDARQVNGAIFDLKTTRMPPAPDNNWRDWVPDDMVKWAATKSKGRNGRSGSKDVMGLLDRLSTAASAAVSAATAKPFDPTNPQVARDLEAAKKAAISEVNNYKFMVDFNDAQFKALDDYVKATAKSIAGLRSAQDVIRLTEGIKQATAARNMIRKTMKTPFSRLGAKAEMAASISRGIDTKKGGQWITGTWDGGTWGALVFSEPSEAYGIPEFPHISKFYMNPKGMPGFGDVIVNYERGWDIKPATPELQKAYREIAQMITAAAKKAAAAGWYSRPGAKATASKAEVEETEEQKAGLKLMAATDQAVSDKIRTLIKEGKPQDQAVAIALDMKRRGEL